MIDLILSAPVFILGFVFVMSVVVVFHELGHYWVARWSGVAIESFSIGFGSTLFGWTDKHGTVWRVAALPLGGYVRFLGDADAASAPDTDSLKTMRAKLVAEKGEAVVRRVFHFQPLWRRAAIVAAGPVANFILAIAVFAGIYIAFGSSTIPPVVGEVLPETPAAEAGLQAGDRIVSIDNELIDSFDDVVQAVVLRSGEPLDFLLDREGERIPLVVTPRRTEREDPIGGRMASGFIGVAPQRQIEFQRHNPVEALAMGAGQTWSIVAMTGDYVGRIFQGKESADMLGGPVRIATYSGKMAVDSLETEGGAGAKLQTLLLRMISLAGFISVGLGLVNLLPIPVLDGGHLLYYAFEAIAGRPLGEKAQAFGFRAGLFLIVGFMLFATWNDLLYLRGFFS